MAEVGEQEALVIQIGHQDGDTRSAEKEQKHTAGPAHTIETKSQGR